MIPLVEKYRPKDFNEAVGIIHIPDLEEIIKKPKEMPNLMFVGPQGIGKTSIAKIIINNLKPIDVIRINGSDTTGVDTIRDTVYNFMTAMSTQKDKPKLIWIEEFDYMSDSAFAALRAMMERFVKNARFIVTCNYIKKIPEPILSRFSVTHFQPIPQETLLSRLKYIIQEEGITATDKALEKIVISSRGDLRAAINTLQKAASNTLKTVDEDKLTLVDEITEQVYELLVSGDWSKIRYDIPGKYPDYNNLLVNLDEKFLNSNLPIPTKVDVNDIIAQGLFEMSFSFNHDICFAAIAGRLIKRLQK